MMKIPPMLLLILDDDDDDNDAAATADDDELMTCMPGALDYYFHESTCSCSPADASICFDDANI